MKRLSFLMIAAAGLLFNACSDDAVNAGSGGQKSEVIPSGYLSLDINLPVTPSTRAANDDFDDGVSNEYLVHDCALLLFQGTDERNARLISAQSVMLPSKETNSDDGITTTHTAVATVEEYESGNNLYALAILNYKNVMSIDASTGKGIPSFLNEKGEYKAATIGKDNGYTISDIRKLQTKANLTTRAGEQNYFFMTNALLTTDQGGQVSKVPVAANVFQLAQLDDTKIKQSMQEAINNPAGEIYVERAVAKATLTVTTDVVVASEATENEDEEEESQDGPAQVDEDTQTTEPETLSIASVEWTLDNMEPTSFIARNPGYSDESNNYEPDWAYVGYTSGYYASENQQNYYRFVGNTPMTSALINAYKPTVYRTYWCVDPHYVVDNDGKGTNQDGFMLPAEKGTNGQTEFVMADKTKNTYTNPLYCYENTFDVARQSVMNTTRAIIKVTLGEDMKNFWTVNNIAGYFKDVEKAKSYVLKEITGNTEVVTWFQKNLKEGVTKVDVLAEYFTVSYKDTRDAINGQLKVNGITLNNEKSTEILSYVNFNDITAAENSFQKAIKNNDTDVVADINNEVIISQYEGGVMYYEARFKHFAGDTDLAPWNTWESKVEGRKVPKGGSTDVAYPDVNNPTQRSNDYLGRYGMVRNNWYDVEVTAFTNLGLPVDPSGKAVGDDTPDDDIKEYISCKIHVLAWAKRMQSWNF